MEDKIVGALIGLAVGAVAEKALMALGVPKHVATVAGGVIGAVLA